MDLNLAGDTESTDEAEADAGRVPDVTNAPRGMLRAIADRTFGHLHADSAWEEEVRAAQKRGQVVYVARSPSLLDFLALDHLTASRGLPRVRFVSDLGSALRGLAALRRRTSETEEAALRTALEAGQSALLFLRRRPGIPSPGSAALPVDLVRPLVELQRQLDRPILLVPQTFTWTKRPPNVRKTLVDLLFGPAEWPGRLRVMLQFALNHKNALLRSGEPFDVRAFLESHQDLTDAQAADAIRYALLRRIERERSLVLGPATKTSGRIVDELLRSPRVRAHMARAANDDALELRQIEREARADLEQLCAALDPTVVELSHRLVDRLLWHRIYDGLVIDTEGLERLRVAARSGPLVLLPSHRSHIDYLIVSDAMYQHGLAPPLIAAGENLSFFPLGPVLRRSGAFFIKRTFKGRKLYPKLVDAYIRKILVEGHSIEVFLEGGRSRTGKLLPPKLGILSMIVDAALQLNNRDITLVPISICYERIVEETSYLHEQGGGEKKRESIGGLIGARRVLRGKYGRLYLEFGELLSFKALAAEAQALRERRPNVANETADASELGANSRRELTQRIAHRVSYEINRATVVTPTALLATALMVHKRRGITRDQLARTCKTLLGVLVAEGARIAPTVTDGHSLELRPAMLDEVLKLWRDARNIVVLDDGAGGDEPIYAAVEERRLALELSKNSILHFFVPSALISSTLLVFGGEVSRELLEERVRRLSRLFKLEFMYRADADFGVIVDDALEGMSAAGELELKDGMVRRGAGASGTRISMYAEMLRPYFEGYRVALLALRPLIDGARPALSRREHVRESLALGKRRWATGQLTLRESLSRQKIENALQAFIELRIVAVDGEVLVVGNGGRTVWTEVDAMLVRHLMVE